MKVLAIETSGRAANVAVLSGDRILVKIAPDANLPISKTLLPAIRSACDTAGIRLDTVDLIAVSRGPGAFTGLRVGVTAAKTLAFALGLPLVACDSLEVLAAAVVHSQNWPSETEVCSLIGAERGEVFARRFRFPRPWQAQPITATEVSPPESLLATLPRAVVLTGPALARWTPPTGIAQSDPKHWHADAAILGMLGQRYFQEGRTSDPFELVPHYHRPSYAEEKRSGVQNP